MAAEDPNELVRIKHPDVAAVGGPVSRKSVEETWQHKGWSILSPAEADAYAEDVRIATVTERPVEDVTAERLAKASKKGGGS